MADNSNRDISSAGMDKKIKKKTFTPKRIMMVVGGLAILALFIYSFAFMDVRSTLNVDREKLTISTVEEDVFQDFMQVNGTVQPIETAVIDAAEGGQVVEIVLESGTMVAEGDTIMVLSNSDLELNIMQRTADFFDQINNLQNRRLEIERNNVNMRRSLANADHALALAESRYERALQLRNEGGGAISEAEFEETRIDYEHQQRLYNFEHQSFEADSVRAQNQLAQIEVDEDRLQEHLEATRATLDRLTIRAPTSGQLSMNEFQPGETIGSGQRIGQVDVLESYKIRVQVDEYYLQRITTGLRGTWSIGGETHELEITKVFPTIEGGQFEVEMEFLEEAPSSARRGLTARIRLELGESSTALLLANGGFYQDSGGSWVYKVTEDGDQAVRQDIRIGRQNPEHFEVLSGLQPGDRVITSSYDTFGDNEVLNLQ